VCCVRPAPQVACRVAYASRSSALHMRPANTQ
jgi:hypothetical protein